MLTFTAAAAGVYKKSDEMPHVESDPTDPKCALSSSLLLPPLPPYFLPPSKRAPSLHSCLCPFIITHDFTLSSHPSPTFLPTLSLALVPLLHSFCLVVVVSKYPVSLSMPHLT